jgi:hypothetical protein
VASGVRFAAHSIGGYVVVWALLKGVDVVVHLWHTSPRPYLLVLLALQASFTLYAAVKIGKITEHLSDIRAMMRT